MATHKQGRAKGEDGLFHYVKWLYKSKKGDAFNGLSWCSYDLNPDTPTDANIRCYEQTLLDNTPINCMRCAARDPRDPRPWG